MKKMLMAAGGLFLALAVGSAGVAAADDAAGQPFGSAAEKAAIEAIVHDYLVKNPEVLIEIQQALEKKQSEAQKLAQEKAIGERADSIFRSASDGFVGNPDGKITIVEFFDYNCHFCKGALEDMQGLVKNNKDLRFVLKEFPILGPDSQKASIVSMAFKSLMPEKYGEFHSQLLGGDGRADEARAVAIAVSLGADEAALRKAMADPALLQGFTETYDLANRLAITGTPSYVLGNEVVFGALGEAVLQEKVANIRACAETTC